MTDSVRGPGRPAGSSGADLVAVARGVFLERGYAGTSMDEVAKRAKISKASLYREHSSKPALFAAVVRDWAHAGRDAMRPALARLGESGDVRAALVELGETMRAGILSTPVLEMRRLVTAEATAHPDVAERYLEESWNANIENLAAALQGISEQGRLQIEDSHAAAEQFTWLVIGAPLNAQLLGGAPAGAYVSRAVELFLAGYGVDGSR